MFECRGKRRAFCERANINRPKRFNPMRSAVLSMYGWRQGHYLRDQLSLWQHERLHYEMRKELYICPVFVATKADGPVWLSIQCTWASWTAGCEQNQGHVSSAALLMHLWVREVSVRGSTDPPVVVSYPQPQASYWSPRPCWRGSSPLCHFLCGYHGCSPSTCHLNVAPEPT